MAFFYTAKNPEGWWVFKDKTRMGGPYPSSEAATGNCTRIAKKENPNAVWTTKPFLTPQVSKNDYDIVRESGWKS